MSHFGGARRAKNRTKEIKKKSDKKKKKKKIRESLPSLQHGWPNVWVYTRQEGPIRLNEGRIKPMCMHPVGDIPPT